MVSQSVSGSPSPKLRNLQQTIPAPTITTVDQRLQTIQNIYKLLRTEFKDLPKFAKSNHVVHSYKYEIIKDKNVIIDVKFIGTCYGKMGSELAHTHSNQCDTLYPRICYKRKYLLALPLVTPVRSWWYQRNERCMVFDKKGRYNKVVFWGDLYWPSLAELSAHESSHLVVKCDPGCRGHCREQKLRCREHQEFLRKCELDGRLQRCVVGKNMPIGYELLPDWKMPRINDF